jgi:hypothetical protein
MPEAEPTRPTSHDCEERLRFPPHPVAARLAALGVAGARLLAGVLPEATDVRSFADYFAMLALPGGQSRAIGARLGSLAATVFHGREECESASHEWFLRWLMVLGCGQSNSRAKRGKPGFQRSFGENWNGTCAGEASERDV